MIKYNNKKHFKLIQQFLDYEKQLEDYLFWTKKSDFGLWMQNYIENSITPEEFETAFSSLWNSTLKEFDEIQLDLERLKNFHPNPEAANGGSYITCVYR